MVVLEIRICGSLVEAAKFAFGLPTRCQYMSLAFAFHRATYQESLWQHAIYQQRNEDWLDRSCLFRCFCLSLEDWGASSCRRSLITWKGNRWLMMTASMSSKRISNLLRLLGFGFCGHSFLS